MNCRRIKLRNRLITWLESSRTISRRSSRRRSRAQNFRCRKKSNCSKIWTRIWRRRLSVLRITKIKISRSTLSWTSRLATSTIKLLKSIMKDLSSRKIWRQSWRMAQKDKRSFSTKRRNSIVLSYVRLSCFKKSKQHNQRSTEASETSRNKVANQKPWM